MELYSYSWRLASIGLVVCIIMLLISHPFVTYNNPQKNNVAKGIWLFFLLYILNSIFSFWEWDTYHSWIEFAEVSKYSVYDFTYYEPVYRWLAKATNCHYFLWRSCIWTPACLFMYFSGKSLNILNRNFLVSMSLFCAFLYSTRNLLGIAMLLFGLTLLLDKNGRYKLWGVALVVASYFFHRTMFITMLFALLAFFPQNKKSITFLIFLLPFLTIVSTFLIDNIVSGALIIGDESNKVTNYASQEKQVSTLFGIIQQIITYLPQYLALTYVTVKIIYQHILKGDRQEYLWTFVFKFSFIAIYIATIFLFTETSFWIFERFKYMGMIPLTFVLAKVWSLEPRTNLWVKFIILLQLFSLTTRWVIQYYHWS